MKVLFSRPLTAPPGPLPEGFTEIECESNLSARFARRLPAPVSERLARLYLALKLLTLRRRYDAVVTGRYGELFAVLQSLLPFRRPHLLLDVEWYGAHRSHWRDRLSVWLHRRIAESADAIQVFCRVEAANYGAHFGVDESRFVWIPFCSAVSCASEQTPPGEFILSSGVHERDYPTLLSAVASLPVELRIAAPAAAFRDLAVPSNVRILGNLSPDGYMAALRSARFLVLSLVPDVIRRPGVITYVTAMRAGKCVVVNDRLGAGSYIEHGETGFLIESADAAALRAQIRALLDDPEKVEVVGRNAECAARQHFSPDAYFAAVRQVTRHAIGTGSAKTARQCGS